MVTLGSVQFNIVDDEKVTKTNDITDYPVEDSTVISDNVERKPLTLPIAGMINGEGAFERLQQLRKYSDEGTLLQYRGRNAFDNCVIETITTVHNNTVKGGFVFTAVLKQVLLSELQETNIDFEVVRPQSVNGIKSLGKKSIIEVEEDTLGRAVGGDYKFLPIPDYREVRKAINDKIELRNTKGREAMTEELNKFKSDERRELRPNSYSFEGTIGTRRF